MNKHAPLPKSKYLLRSITALLLLVGICTACTSQGNSSDTPKTTADQSISAATLPSDPISSASSNTSATTEPSAAQTTAPVTTAPEADTSLKLLQAVMSATPRDAEYLAVYDLTADRTLYTTGDEQQIYPASTTKLFTILYALTIVNESDVFKVGKEIEIAPYDSSKAWISIDQQFTVRDLVAAMLLPSGNDAAYTLAVGCGRKKADDSSLAAADALAVFMKGMNDYAAELGLDGSHFVTPDGYHDADHYTTVQDMTKIACMAYENALMKEIMAMPSYTATPLNFGKALTWENTNLLLSEESKYYFPDATGMKTGYHSDAGSCLVTSAERNGRTLIVLLFKGSDKMGRFSETKSVLEMCFSMLEG